MRIFVLDIYFELMNKVIISICISVITLTIFMYRKENKVYLNDCQNQSNYLSLYIKPKRKFHTAI